MAEILLFSFTNDLTDCYENKSYNNNNNDEIVVQKSHNPLENDIIVFELIYIIIVCLKHENKV